MKIKYHPVAEASSAAFTCEPRPSDIKRASPIESHFLHLGVSILDLESSGSALAYIT